jgi:hypothetical protein
MIWKVKTSSEGQKSWSLPIDQYVKNDIPFPKAAFTSHSAA